MKSPLGITYIVPAGQEATGIYEADHGVEVFVSDEPYLVSGGLQNPLPVFDAGGPVFTDSMGRAQFSLAVRGDIPETPEPPEGITWDANTTWDNGTYWS